VCQFYNQNLESKGGGTPSTSWPGREHTHIRRPFRIEPLPALVPAAKISPIEPKTCGGGPPDAPGQSNTYAEGISPRGGRHRARHLLLGVGGDELAPAWVKIQEGGVLAILGGRGAGKTNLIRSLPQMNPAGGPWLQPSTTDDPTEFWQHFLSKAADGVEAGTVALVDDADLLPAEALQQLSELNGLGCTVVLTANYSPSLLQRVPLIMKSRASGTGVLLAPRAPSDGDLFGVRLDIDAHPPPGRAQLISEGAAVEIQAGWTEPSQ
jgi:S-DNA-T family DNA segregation ATPase FtsK/SpoIIIE